MAEKEKKKEETDLDMAVAACQTMVVVDLKRKGLLITQQINTILTQAVQDDGEGRNMDNAYLLCLQEVLLSILGKTVAAQAFRLSRSIPEVLLGSTNREDLNMELVELIMKQDIQALRLHTIDSVGNLISAASKPETVKF